MTTLAVLAKPWQTSPAHPPEHWPLGRAALSLADDGIQVVFASELEQGVARGQRAVPGRWEPTTTAVQGAWDRFPSQTFPQHWAALLDGLSDGLVGNPAELTLLCRDKVACQHTLMAAGVRMPQLEHRPEHFERALAQWGSAFAKPRHGALGRGVRRVETGEHLPSSVDGAVPGSTDALILQRGVPLWGGFGGLSVRALVQRGCEGDWVCCPPVARTHPTDPVANVARGATVLAADELFGSVLTARIRELAIQAAEALGDHATALELGVDVVVAEDGTPWVIEVNGVPRGHLAALARVDAARWSAAHLEACTRPLRRLATLVG